MRLREAAQTLQTWPWAETVRTLVQRFREDHLSLTASSLTFTTLIALVPLVTVMLALFAAFPMFAQFQIAIEQYLTQSLVPEQIAIPVLSTLTAFAAKANRLGAAGLALLVLTALALMLTMDRALNAIWRVRRPRPLGQRVLVYWAALTLGPLVLGASLTLTSYAVSASKGLVVGLPGGLATVLGLLEFSLLVASLAALFHYVPNTDVRWRHALAGGVFAALGFEAAKRGLGWYVGVVPTYSTVYGAFATLPIFLLWIYLCWVVVLLGAVVAAYAPSLSMQLARRGSGPGQRLALAVDILRLLAAQRESGGLSLGALAQELRVDPLQIETLLEVLLALGWIGRMDEDGGRRIVLLCDLAQTAAAPVLDALLIDPSRIGAGLRARMAWDRVMLAELIAR